jgi:hypothetical protein
MEYLQKSNVDLLAGKHKDSLSMTDQVLQTQEAFLGFYVAIHHQFHLL